MKKSIRKIFSLLLALVMVFSLLPAQAMAEEPEGSIAPVEDPAPRRRTLTNRGSLTNRASLRTHRSL